MNIYKYTLPILLVLISSVTNAQPMSDEELAKFITEKFNTSSFYNEESISLMSIEDANKIDFNAVIQNICKSNKALDEVKMIATKYPQIPSYMVEQAKVSYENGITTKNLLNGLKILYGMSSKEIECNE